MFIHRLKTPRYWRRVGERPECLVTKDKKLSETHLFLGRLPFKIIFFNLTLIYLRTKTSDHLSSSFGLEREIVLLPEL